MNVTRATGTWMLAAAVVWLASAGCDDAKHGPLPGPSGGGGAAGGARQQSAGAAGNESEGGAAGGGAKAGGATGSSAGAAGGTTSAATAGSGGPGGAAGGMTTGGLAQGGASAGGTSGLGGGGASGGAHTGGSVASGPPGGVDWEPWPDVPAADPNVCQLAYFYGGDEHSAPQNTQISTRAFDPTRGVLTITFFLTTQNPSTDTVYFLYNSEGRPLGSCGAGATNNCDEWVRDAHGNMIARQTVTLSRPDVNLLDASHYGTQIRGKVSDRFAVIYDNAGVLLSGEPSTGTGARRTFTEDDEHRCTDVLWQQLPDVTADGSVSASERDHWTWQGDRLVSRLVTNGADASDVRSEITYTYDENGDLAATVMDGIPKLQGATLRASRDGVADYVARTVTLPDGSRWVESLLFNLFTNATVTRNGQPVAAERRRWRYSPGCRALHFPRRTSHHCEFQQQVAELDTHWEDPFISAIPIW